MNGKRVLLLAPIALVSLLGCGGGGKTTIDYEEAKKTVATYAESIGNNRPSKIIVNGNVNKLTIDGDVTYWNYMSGELPFFKTKNSEIVPADAANDFATKETKKSSSSGDIIGLLGLIPNFSEKGMNVTIDEQKITEIKMPALLNSFTSGIEGADDIIFWVIANLPKFPMNERLLWCINGIENPKFDPEKFNWNWEDVKESKWDSMKISYYKEKGGLGMDIEIPSLAKLVCEVTLDVMHQTIPEESDLNFPVKLGLSCNKTGYIDSLSVKFKSDGKITKSGWPKKDLLYLYFDAAVDADFKLNFEQEYTKTVNLAYRVSEYKYENEQLNLDKVGDINTDLEKVKDYFTVNWVGSDTEDEIYDDPVFKYNYWRTRAKNIAYVGEEYYVSIVPKQKETIVDEDKKEHLYSIQPYYTILGHDAKMYSEHYNGKQTLNKLSSNGIAVDISNIASETGRIQYPSAEKLSEYNIYHTFTTGEKETTYQPARCYNFYINPTIMKESNSGTIFLIDIAVVPENVK